MVQDNDWYSCFVKSQFGQGSFGHSFVGQVLTHGWQCSPVSPTSIGVMETKYRKYQTVFLQNTNVVECHLIIEIDHKIDEHRHLVFLGISSHPAMGWCYWWCVSFARHYSIVKTKMTGSRTIGLRSWVRVWYVLFQVLLRLINLFFIRLWFLLSNCLPVHAPSRGFQHFTGGPPFLWLSKSHFTKACQLSI